MEIKLLSDEYFMRIALAEAQKAFDADEIPVGAIIVSKGQVIARAHNMTEKLNDVTAHAEMLAFTSASNFLNSKYLSECTLYVTLEPCVMCAGASFWAQVGTLVYGAKDEKRGYLNVSSAISHPRTLVKGGVMATECGELLIDFFRKKREQ
ncbi:MAG: nucleoside deaminase [Bacteroidota bacterium]|nr:nucleoside deaminase [Bacteroidota bacterium]